MAKRFFVKNNLPNEVVELKPQVGEFRIPSGEKVEFPEELARSLVQDFNRKGLELIEEDVPDPKPKKEKKGILGGRAKGHK